jgi:prevent-host-death family protein
MEEIAISRFKATCLEVLERVRRTRRPVRITRFGKPVAEVTPPTAAKTPPGRLGAMAGTVKVTGDIVGPAAEADTWEALEG